jgi:hypothetical protein
LEYSLLVFNSLSSFGRQALLDGGEFGPGDEVYDRFLAWNLRLGYAFACRDSSVTWGRLKVLPWGEHDDQEDTTGCDGPPV